MLTSTLKKEIADFTMTFKEVISVLYADVQQESGACDCGLFALAFATSLWHDQDPESIIYDQ